MKVYIFPVILVLLIGGSAFAADKPAIDLPVYTGGETVMEINLTNDDLLPMIKATLPMLAGKKSVSTTWWNLNELSQPAVLAGAVSKAMRADVIVVATRATEGFPLPFYIWVSSWLPHYLPGKGTLVALSSGAVSVAACVCVIACTLATVSVAAVVVVSGQVMVAVLDLLIMATSVRGVVRAEIHSGWATRDGRPHDVVGSSANVSML